GSKPSVVLLKRAKAPLAVFWEPVVLLNRARPPVAVLLLPEDSDLSAWKPRAVFHRPVVRLSSACCPSAVFWPEEPPSGGGLTACAVGKTAKQANANSANAA